MKSFCFLPLLSVLTVFGCSASQGLQKKITFDEPAAPINRVLADVSKVSGVTLRADQTMAKEVVIICVKGASLDQLTKRIATVTAGRWEKQAGGAYLLRPDNAVRLSQDKSDVDEKTADLRLQLENLRRRMQRNKELDADLAKSEANGDLASPSEPNLANEFLLRLDPGAIGKLKPNERIVFSTAPTTMQSQLPQIPGNEIAEFITQYNKWVSFERKSKWEDILPGGYMMPQAARKFKERTTLPIAEFPSKILLIVENPGPSVDIRLYDSKGNVLYAKRDDDFPYQGKDPDPDDIEPPARKVDKEPEGVQIRYSDVENELIKPVETDDETKWSGYPPALRKRFLDPADYEPLSLIVGTSIRAVAQERNEQLVGDLPDSLVKITLEDVFETTGGYLAMMKNGDDVNVTEGDGWIQIVPRHPSQSRQGRVDRNALTALLLAAEKQGSPHLEDLAAYALVGDEPSTRAPLWLYFFYINGFGVPELSPVDWPTLRLYASLRTDQREALKNSQILVGRTLSSVQMELLRQIVFGSGARLKVGQVASAPFESESLIQQMLNDGDPTGPLHEHNSLEEPTESLSYGLPGSLTLSASSERSTVIKVPDQKGVAREVTEMTGAMDPDRYALMRTGMVMPNPMAKHISLKKFLVGSRTTYHLKFQLLPNLYMERDLTDDSFPANASPVLAKDLPSDFLAKLRQAVSELKKTGVPFENAVDPTIAGR